MLSAHYFYILSCSVYVSRGLINYNLQCRQQEKKTLYLKVCVSVLSYLWTFSVVVGGELTFLSMSRVGCRFLCKCLRKPKTSTNVCSPPGYPHQHPLLAKVWSNRQADPLLAAASRADSTGCSLGGKLGGRQQEATLIFHSPSCVAGCVAPKTSHVPMRSLLLVWWQIDFCTGKTRLRASTYALFCVLRLWVKILRQVYKMDASLAIIYKEVCFIHEFCFYLKNSAQTRPHTWAEGSKHAWFCINHSLLLCWTEVRWDLVHGMHLDLTNWDSLRLTSFIQKLA